jgi:hypothetical protein
MAESPDIFAKRRLTIGQLRAVADRRFGDALALVETGDNARANGAQYLAGIVVEILSKGQLLQKSANLYRPGLTGLSPDDRIASDLIWRSHDLEEMLAKLPSLTEAVRLQSDRSGVPLHRWLRHICGSWTIFARYSPHSSTIAEAREWVERVRHLKEVLK